jgi:uridine kinase
MPKPVVVGIAGGSASGKSTLAAALAVALEQAHGWRTAIVSTDRYVQPDVARGPTFFSSSAGEAMFDWNHPDSVDWARLVSDLRALCDAQDAPQAVLVEGLMVLHDAALRPLLDLRLFVELEADVRALRRLLRNMQRPDMNRDPVFIATYYRESARVGHERYVEPSRVHADLIVRGDADWERLRPMVIAVVADRYGA